MSEINEQKGGRNVKKEEEKEEKRRRKRKRRSRRRKGKKKSREREEGTERDRDGARHGRRNTFGGSVFVFKACNKSFLLTKRRKKKD